MERVLSHLLAGRLDGGGWIFRWRCRERAFELRIASTPSAASEPHLNDDGSASSGLVARQAIDAPPESAGQRGDRKRFDPVQVAAWVVDGQARLGVAATGKAVGEAFGVDEATGRRWLAKLRSLGLIDPGRLGGVPDR